MSYKNHSLISIGNDYYNCEEPIPKNKGIHLKVDDVGEIIVSDKYIKVVLPDLDNIKITITFKSIVEYSEKYTLIKADEVINKYSKVIIDGSSKFCKLSGEISLPDLKKECNDLYNSIVSSYGIEFVLCLQYNKKPCVYFDYEYLDNIDLYGIIKYY